MSITITITIDGGEMSTTTVAPQSMTAISPETPTPLTPAAGAMDAGAAPSEAELSGMVGLSSPPKNENVPVAAEAGDTAAGPAPSFPPTEH